MKPVRNKVNVNIKDKEEEILTDIVKVGLKSEWGFRTQRKKKTKI
jgi:hypothetical protein